MVTATMAFIPDVDIVISYRQVKSCPLVTNYVPNHTARAGRLGEKVELPYVVEIIGAPAFFGMVVVFWRVLWPLQADS